MSIAGHDEMHYMRDIIAAWRADLKEAVASFGAASKTALDADDIVETMKRAVETVAAADHLHEIVTEMQKKLRTFVAETMMNTGATTVRANGVVGSVREATRQVVIRDRNLIDPAYFIPQEPKLDRDAIGKILRSGGQVAGCDLFNGWPPVLVIKSAKAAKQIEQEAA
jgi:hypothetical protein